MLKSLSKQSSHLAALLLSDAATIIVVNLYIRSFAKIDDVKMVKRLMVMAAFSLRDILSIGLLIYGIVFHRGKMPCDILFLEYFVAMMFGKFFKNYYLFQTFGQHPKF